MRLTITTEYRFCRTPDGAYWSDGTYGPSFWEQYLEVFDAVNVVGRVFAAAEPAARWRRADGPRVAFSEVPPYLGPAQYVSRAGAVRRAVAAAIGRDDAVLVRAPGQIANCAEAVLRRRGQPFGVLVVGDPYDVFAAAVVNHPLRPLIRWWFTRRIRTQCRSAQAALYVTQRTLQQRYPCPAHAVGVSDVELPDEALAAAPRKFGSQPRAYRLISVGSMAQPYKAHDVLLRAVARCVGRGWNLRLALVGEGKYRPELELLSEELGLKERVEFLGQLPAGEGVRAELDRADLFVLASRTEGLPRAMIEAMARGLPCVGSRVGGIPELLDEADLVAPGEEAALAAKLDEVLAAPGRLEAMSARNLAHARGFRQDLLHQRRHDFYLHLRNITAAALARRGAASKS